MKKAPKAAKTKKAKPPLGGVGAHPVIGGRITGFTGFSPPPPRRKPPLGGWGAHQVIGGQPVGLPPFSPVMATAKKHAKARKWTPDEDIALCSARAVAESLRIASGAAVTDADVVALYARTQADPDAGESILAALEAAARFGLAGFRPVGFKCVTAQSLEQPGHVGGGDLGRAARELHGVMLEEVMPHELLPERRSGRSGAGVDMNRAGLILGLELPGPNLHTVLAHNGAWWSWGQLHDPGDWPDAVIEEAWAVQWRP